MNFPWDQLLVKGNWMITMAQIGAPFLVIGLIAVITYFKLWKYLYKEWFTSVDHKKIGIMYLICAVLMFVRGGIDALLIRAQLTVPDNKFLESNHYNEIFRYTWCNHDYLHGNAIYLWFMEYRCSITNWST